MKVQVGSNRRWTPAVKAAQFGGQLLQRKCACGQHTTSGGECDECKGKRDMLQRHSAGSLVPKGVPPIVHDVLRSPGQPLDRETRAFMEPRFGHDFSQVRVHTDTRAANSAHAVDALAYTVGPDIVFGAGQYLPGTSASHRLLGHELTHVVQQSGRGSASLSINTPGDQFEREAERATLSLDEDLSVPAIRGLGGGLMRQQDAGEKKAGAGKEDPNVKELQEKVGKLVTKKFGGDYKKAFDYYDSNHDGADADEIKKLLEDAGVGNPITRGSWVSKILERMDTNKDGKISWQEFQDGIKG